MTTQKGQTLISRPATAGAVAGPSALAAGGEGPIHELAIAGLLLSDPERTHRLAVEAGITSGHFQTTEARAIWRAVEQLHVAGRPLDDFLIVKSCGLSQSACEVLADQAPIASHAEYYVQLAVQAHESRTLAATLTKAVEALQRPENTPEFVVAGLHEKLQGFNSEEGDGWDSYTLEQLLAYTTPPDHVIAGNGLIRRKSGTLFTGGTGLGKSVACADIAVWLAGGKDLFGCVPVKHPWRVLLCQAENDPDTMKRDVEAALKFSGADQKTVNENLAFRHCWGLFGEIFHERLEQFIRQSDPDVVIIDPYQSFVTPGDLNGTAAFLEWIGPIQRLMHERAFALMLVAHTPKPANRQDWNVRQSVYLAAGTSAISNWARASMELMTAEHETDRFRLTFGKNAERNGLTDDHGHVVRELYLQHSGNIDEPYWSVADNQAKPGKSKFAEDINRLCEQNPGMSYQEIADALGCSKGLVGKYLGGKNR